MKSTTLKQAVLGVGVVGILAFLYLNTQAGQSPQHKRLLDNLRQLKQADAMLTQAMLESRYGLLATYDPLVNMLARVKTLQKDIGADLTALYGAEQAGLKDSLQACTDVLTQQEEIAEQFKTRHAVLKNSL